MFETLVTLVGSNHYGSESMAEHVGVPIPEYQRAWRPSEHDRSVGAITTKEGITIALRKLGKYSDELLEEMMRRRVAAKKRVFSEEFVDPGVLPMLRELRKRGVKVALISNCYDEEAAAIRESSIFRCVDVAMLSCEQGVCKPDPEIYRRCLAKLGVGADECLYVGDGGSLELEVATEVGMHPLQAAWYLVPGEDQPCGRLPEYEQADCPADVLKYLA